MAPLRNDPLVRCVDLECGYVGRPILRSVSFELATGQIVALLGPNGSGKSTLLKSLSGTLAVRAGAVEVTGERIESLSANELAKRVAFVPQDEHTQFAFTVHDVVMMGRLPHSEGLMDSRADHEAVEQALVDADCMELANRSVLELSGGERQRVWIARALAQGAPILLLDEPTAHLDVAHQLALVRLLKSLASRGIGVLAAIHDLNVASMLADTAMLLSTGTIVRQGPCREVLTSQELDAAYNVRFERLTDFDPIRVFPQAP
jgi:iron complex transport system ATP-binding protein